MSKTINEIAVSVLRKLGRLPAGQVATADQIKTVTDEYEGLYNELYNDSLVTWSSSDDIPAYAENPIKRLLLSRTADNFGVQNVWFQLEELQRRLLARGMSSPYVYQPTLYENF